MLSKSLECEAIPLNQMSKVNPKNYDTFIFGGWVRASIIIGLRSFIKHLPTNSNQKVVIFAVGANGESEQNTKELINKNIEANHVSYSLFYLQGGFDPNKLNFPLRVMLQGVAKSLKKKQESSPEAMTQEDKDFLEFFQEKHNNIDPENLTTLVNYIKEK